MDILSIIPFGLAQASVLLLILSRKKFGTQANLLLACIFGLMIIHYGFFYLLYNGTIKEYSALAAFYIPLATVPPVLIYFYSKAVMYDQNEGKVINYWHLTPFGLLTVLLLIDPHKGLSNYVFKTAGMELLALSYLGYTILTHKGLKKYYQTIKAISSKVSPYHRKKTSIVRLLIVVLVIHFVILLAKAKLPMFIPGINEILDILNVGFLILLSYMITYIMISEPKAIHNEDRVQLGDFRTYEKSGLTRSEAIRMVLDINELMESEKPYLDPEFNLKKLAQKSECNKNKVSEVLNGFIGQSFNDYVNNFRVEEFKRLAVLPEYKNYSILALSFEVGFNSKATFNAAFKKFTGTTPSAYIQSVS